MITSWRVEQVVAPAAEPLTVAQIEEQLRLPSGQETELLESYIKSVRQRIERGCGISFMEQTRRVFLDAFPYCGVIELPYSPVREIASVKYLDSEGELQTLASGNESPALEAQYLLDNKSFPSRIYRAYNVTWPVTRLIIDAVQIEYVCGFPDEVGSSPVVPALPEDMLTEMKRAIGHWYENRETTAPGDVLPKEVDDLLCNAITNFRVSHF